MTKLERCARAFLKALPEDFYTRGEEDPRSCTIDGCGDITPAIRAVLTELLNPDEGMIEEGGRTIARVSSGRAIKPYEDDAREALQAMIQHILKEGEG